MLQVRELYATLIRIANNDIDSFPTPIHDASFAFDFLTATYLPKFQETDTFDPTPSSTPTGNLQRPIFLAGSFLGGTLATSLSLTSTFANIKNSSHYVAGLITYNAPFDWTSVAVLHPSQIQPEVTHERSIGETTNSVEKTRLEKDAHEWTARSLLNLRTDLFTTPGSAFDSFASPVLFFHTPGYVVPQQWPGSEAKPEQDRYSTSLDDEEDDLVFEAPDFDVAGNGEKGEAEIIGSTGLKQSQSKMDEVATVTKEEEVYSPEIARTSYLKFPPTIAVTNSAYARFAGSGPLQEQLKIPRSLLLYLSPPTPTAESGTKKKGKKSKGLNAVEQISPEAQAKEMARLMRRSVLMVESKDRTMWDDSFDANSVANDRVRVLDVEEAQSGKKTREWLEDCLG